MIEIETEVRLRESYRLSMREANAACDLVQARLQELRDAWRALHGE